MRAADHDVTGDPITALKISDERLEGVVVETDDPFQIHEPHLPGVPLWPRLGWETHGPPSSVTALPTRGSVNQPRSAGSLTLLVVEPLSDTLMRVGRRSRRSAARRRIGSSRPSSTSVCSRGRPAMP